MACTTRTGGYRYVTLYGFAVVAFAVAAPAAVAQSFDGNWTGQISCAKLSFTRATQTVPITMTISGGSASYSRQVYNEDNSAVVGTEVGSGTVAATGAIAVSARWQSAGAAPRFTYTASYSGTIAGNAATLQGTQVWSFDGKTENRSCSITMRR
jgi:hypothetical protein